MTIEQWYERVNAAWPDNIPQLTAGEAKRAAKRLYRYGMRRTFRGRVVITSGNRSTWVMHGELRVNPGDGWHGLVHMLSHYAHRRRFVNEKPHSKSHARLELAMVKQVVKRGWLNGALLQAAKHSEQRKIERKLERNSPEAQLMRLDKRAKQWRVRATRAVNALRKIERQRKRLVLSLTIKPRAVKGDSRHFDFTS